MGSTARTQLVPIQELTPGGIGAIRNQVIASLVAKASKEMFMPPEKLVVRDIRPLGDLQLYDDSAGNARTTEDWEFDVTAAASGYESITGTATMGDQRYVAIYGVRDLRLGRDQSPTVTGSSGFPNITVWPSFVSLLRISVGGGDKVIWDTQSMQSYKQNLVAFAPSAVIIPQNTSYNISIYKTRAVGGNVYIQFIGVIVEPRGLLISP